MRICTYVSRIFRNDRSDESNQARSSLRASRACAQPQPQHPEAPLPVGIVRNTANVLANALERIVGALVHGSS